MRLLLFVAAILLALSLPAQLVFSKTNGAPTSASQNLLPPATLPLVSMPAAFFMIDKEGNAVDTPRIKDKDGDGVPDSLDKCPDEKGVQQYDGCPFPDSDSDGIADDADSCPTVAGTPKHNGCPPGDRDGDKINDDEDKCPDTPGVARNGGCPIGDADNDGVNDDEDNCKTVPGSVKNFGCPETKGSKKAAKEKKKH